MMTISELEMAIFVLRRTSRSAALVLAACSPTRWLGLVHCQRNIPHIQVSWCGSKLRRASA